MIKKLFFITSIFLLIYFSPSSALTETKTQQTIKKDTNYLLELYENDKWGFIGKKFIDEWEWKYDSSEARNNVSLFNLLSLLFLDSTIVMGSIVALDDEYINLDWISCKKSKIIFTTVMIEAILITLLHIIITKKLNKQIDKKIDKRNHEIMKNFLNNWQTYKNITPEELHPLFEKIIPIFNELKKSDDRKIISEIQQQVRSNHSIYYEKYKKPLVIIH